MTGRPRILVVEDEVRIANFVVHGLRVEGYEVAVAANAARALASLAWFDPELVLLDLMLPGAGGLALLPRIREWSPDVPVIIVSARRDLATRLAGLRAGANDYLVKPFSFDELLERMEIHLRAAGLGVPDAVLQAGSLVLDTRTREVDAGSGPIRLSDREFSLLEQLARRHGAVVPRQLLLNAVWGHQGVPHANVLEVCIKRLRRKLGADTIETVRSAGYRLVA